MNKIIFSIFFSLISLLNYSQICEINGSIPNAGGKKIRIYTNTNLISSQEIKILEDSVYKDNSFNIKLKLEPQQVLQIYFAVERLKSNIFFIEAGKSYNLDFDTANFHNQEYIISPLIPNNELVFNLKNDTNELNFLIKSYNHILDSFTIFHLPEIIKSRDKEKINSFINFVQTKYQKIKHTYFQNYLNYTIAHLQFVSRIENMQELYNTYIHEKPFLYNHPAYMDFFNDFYNSFIYQYSQKIPLKDLDLNISQNPNSFALLDSLGKEPLLKDEVVREMVLIKNLTQMYYNHLYSNYGVTEVMKQIMNNTKFAQHKHIVSILLKEMEESSLPRKAPLLNIRKDDLSKLDLNNFLGQYTYILFFTTWCNSCLCEFLVLQKIYNTYNNDMFFLAISMDVNFHNFHQFIEANQYEWEFANFAKNFDIEDEWKVRIFPQAFMLDAQGHIINENAPLPSENLDRYLKHLLLK